MLDRAEGGLSTACLFFPRRPAAVHPHLAQLSRDFFSAPLYNILVIRNKGVPDESLPTHLGRLFFLPALRGTLRNVPQHCQDILRKIEKRMGKSMENFTEQKGPLGLYDHQFEHDACGIGAAAAPPRRKCYQIVSDAPSRTPMARPATAWASCYRLATASLPR